MKREKGGRGWKGRKGGKEWEYIQKEWEGGRGRMKAVDKGTPKEKQKATERKQKGYHKIRGNITSCIHRPHYALTDQLILAVAVMKKLCQYCLLANILRQKPRELKHLIELRVEISLDDFGLEDLVLVREKEEDNERATGVGRCTLHHYGEVVGLLNVDGQHSPLDVVVEGELEGRVRVGGTLDRAEGT